MTEILRIAAFTDTPAGGNPAGVVLDAEGLDGDRMLAIAAEVGYSETAFLVPRNGGGEYDVRYFSPLAEVPFCGHATIGSAVALAERDGPGELLLHTRAGDVKVRTRVEEGRSLATLTSVPAHAEDVADADVDAALALLRWERADLDPALAPRIGYAGARHLILAAATRDRLARLDYDFDGLKAFMLERDLTTLQLVWRESQHVFHSRNPFPVGGVVEDPATGAAAAAFGAYLRDGGLVEPPARVEIHQGSDMGRPSHLLVDIPAGRPEIDVTGGGVPIR
jgi:PhzF family phenazine biosynthesis protein